MFVVSTTVSIFVAVFRNGKSNYPLHSFRPKGTINSTATIGKNWVKHTVSIQFHKPLAEDVLSFW